MDTRDTLLAHLVPTLTSQTENAATKSLAYILNKAEPTRRALNEMVRAGVGVTTDPVEQVRVEVAAEDQSRPDFVGYDVNGTKRVIGESKFWAPLGKGQGSAYLKQLASGPSVLMFVVPEARLISLWDDVVSDIEEGAIGVSLQPLEAPDSMMAAREGQSERYVLMVSWRALLDRMLGNSTGDQQVQSDIQQLRGLTELMDSEAFLPLKKEDLGPEIPRRYNHFVRLFMDATRQLGGPGGVISWTGPISSSYNSCGRYLTISGTSGWLGIHYDLWGRGDSEDTPLWLQLYELEGPALAHVSHELGLRGAGWKGSYFAIHLKVGVVMEDVLGDVVCQLERIARNIESSL